MSQELEIYSLFGAARGRFLVGLGWQSESILLCSLMYASIVWMNFGFHKQGGEGAPGLNIDPKLSECLVIISTLKKGAVIL